MAIIISEGEKKFHLVPAGTLKAVCFGVWDIGLHKQEVMGHVKVYPKVIFGFETDERIKSNDAWDGQRFRIYKRYTMSLYEKAALKKDLESWRGKAFTDDERKHFDIEALVGNNCYLSIVHNENNGKIYANINGVMMLPKGLVSISPENKPDIPEWVQKVKAQALTSDEAERIRDEERENVSDESNIPF